ncbi:MAG: methyltransferase [Acidimicrobiales bacterium]
MATDTEANRILQLCFGSLLTQLVGIAAELGVADLLAHAPKPVEELADRTGADADGLYRVLRALAAQGIFTEVGPRTFGLTPAAAALRQGVPGSMRDLARYFGMPARNHAFVELLHAVRTGEPAFDHFHGTDYWSYLAQHPDDAAIFDNAMGNLARQIHAVALDSCDLSGARRLVDVGGGHGVLAAALLGRYPELVATVFDLPHVVSGADKSRAAAGGGHRAETVGGDFFTAVPEGGDAYVLSMILHDWDDARATSILANVRRAMDPGGKVIVVDAVLPKGDHPHLGKLLDIVMLAVLPGRERTEAEFAALFHAAGLRHVETRAPSSPTSVLVATAA